MPDDAHTVRAQAKKSGFLVMTPGLRYFEEVSLRAVGDWTCSCGAEFRSESEAREHVEDHR